LTHRGKFGIVRSSKERTGYVMKFKVVLFDLDGTLLPMDQDAFIKDYFSRLAMKLIPHGYDPKQLVDAIWGGTAAMVKNDGKCTNEEVFWQSFTSVFGEEARRDEPIFEEFYRVEFQEAKALCGFNPKAKKCVDAIKKMGCRVVLATNPLFPAIATQSRTRWAGLEPEDFELYTTYENSCYCKPNPAYYQEILKKIGCGGSECLMVGNDAVEDCAAEQLGMKVFLLTDCLINKKNRDISGYPQGSFPELLDYLRQE